MSRLARRFCTAPGTSLAGCRYNAFQAARALLARINDGSGVIVLTDVFGATPSRIAARLCEPERVEVLAGVNLPVLIKALSHRRLPLAELVKLLVEAGQQAIVQIHEPAFEASAREPLDAER